MPSSWGKNLKLPVSVRVEEKREACFEIAQSTGSKTLNNQKALITGATSKPGDAFTLAIHAGFAASRRKDS